MIKIHVIVCGPLAVNCCIVSADDADKCVILDPGGDALRISRYLDENGLKPEAILLTHGHMDHIGGVNELRAKYGIPVIACEKERALLADPGMNLSSVFGLDPIVLSADRWCREGDLLDLAGLIFAVIETPGHTAGSVSYYIKEEHVLFSGDTLFHYSTGRTDFPTGSESEIRRSLKEKLFLLPSGTHVYPGHDEDFIMN